MMETILPISFSIFFPIIEGYIDSRTIKRVWYINHKKNIILVSILYILFFSLTNATYLVAQPAIYWVLHDLSLNIFMGWPPNYLGETAKVDQKSWNSLYTKGIFLIFSIFLTYILLQIWPIINVISLLKL